MEANPNVRLRVGDSLYSLKAVPVHEEQERGRVYDAYVEKYKVNRADIPNNAGLIYRLDAR